MNKIILLLSVLISTQLAKAQLIMDGRVLTVFNEAYTDLGAGKTIHASAVDWDDLTFTVPFGFNYYLNNKAMTSVVVDPDNIIDGICASGFTLPNVLIGIGLDARNRNQIGSPNPNSSINSIIDTKDSKKIAKLEYNNIGFFEDTTNTLFLNFQYWMYEKDSAFEYRFGKNNIDSNLDLADLFPDSGGFLLGNFKNLNVNTFSFDKFYSVTNLNPKKVDSFNAAQLLAGNASGLSRVPDSGTVVRLAYPVISIPAAIGTVNLTNNINVNTDISNGQLKINFINENKNYTCTLLSMNGNVVYTAPCTSTNNVFDIAHLPSSNYILLLHNNNEKVAYQVRK
jgi:hypothetical protein